MPANQSVENPNVSTLGAVKTIQGQNKNVILVGLTRLNA